SRPCASSSTARPTRRSERNANPFAGLCPTSGDGLAPRCFAVGEAREYRDAPRGVARELVMTSTYTAVEVSSPGKFRVVERPLVAPGAGQVRLRVEACGVCHSDAATVEGKFPGLEYPRVPGHEVIGKIDALGPGVAGWAVGQRVGLGFFGGEDRTCEPCRRGDFAQCLHSVIPGITVDGGYAEVLIAEARAIARIPDGVDPVQGAPLLCAGVT